jgi:hypothetical protein
VQANGDGLHLALAISRLTDGVQLLVERVLDHHEALAEAKL